MTTETYIDCGDSLDIARAGSLHARLLAALESGQPVVLAGAQVARADGAGLQVFAAFLRSARCAHLRYRWQEPSPALRQAAAVLGLARELELPAS
jgi:anti-anti-sigma regulatory factor